MRKLLAAVAALALALGSTLALSQVAQAGSDNCGGCIISSSSVNNIYDNGTYSFNGVTRGDVVITDVTASFGGEAATSVISECTVTPGGPDNSNYGDYSCSLVPSPAFTIGSATVTIDYTWVPAGEPVSAQLPLSVNVLAIDPTIAVTSGSIYPDGTLTFGGTQDLQMPIYAVNIDGYPDLVPGEDCDFSQSNWSCSFAPGDFPVGVGTIWAYFDSESSISADFTVDPYPTVPDISYDLSPGEISVTGTPTGVATLVAIQLYSYTYNPADYWNGVDGCPVPGSDLAFDGVDAGTSVCTFGGLDAGVYNAYSYQDNGSGGTTEGAVVSDYFVIPDTPTIDEVSVNSDGTIFFAGAYGDGSLPADSVVITSAGDIVSCPIYNYLSYWYCTTDSAFGNGTHGFRAYGVDTGSLQVDAISDATYRTGGASALSPSQSVTIAFPTVGYQFYPGAVAVSTELAPGGTVARSDLYSLEDSGEGFFYNWDSSCGGPDPVYTEGWGWSGSKFTGIAADRPNYGCTFDELGSGLWSIESQQDDGGGIDGTGNVTDDYFFVPVAPAISSATANADGTVSLVGTGVSGFPVTVVTQSGLPVCTELAVSANGDWSCTTGALAAGSYGLLAYSEDTGAGENEYVWGSYVSGGLSGFSSIKAVSIAGLPSTGGNPPSGPPSPPLIVPSWFFTLAGIDLNNLHPGDKFTINGAGLPPGAVISAELHSTPVSLGVATVAPTGGFALSASVPENIEPGNHAVVVTLSGPGLETTTKEVAVTITAVEAEAGGAASEGGDAAHSEGDAAGGHGGAESTLTGNILTDSMNPILEVVNDPGRIPAAFAAGLVLLIFAIMPAHLLNATLGEQYERFARRMPRLATQPKWYTALRAAFTRAPVIGGLILTTTTAFLFAFADPNFGFNTHSLRLFLALAGALFVVTYFANAITGMIMRRGWNVDVEVTIRPLGLVLTVVGVLASRLLEFSPGFLIGLVLGLTITQKAASHHAWKAVLIRASVIMTFAIASWITYTALAPGVHENPTFSNELMLELFVAIATEGTVMLLVELLPFHLLEGERLYKKSRLLWGAIYTVILVVFILAVVPWEGNWRELGESFWPWFTAVAIFGAVCMAIYLYFRFIAPPLHHDEQEETRPDEPERIAVGNDIDN